MFAVLFAKKLVTAFDQKDVSVHQDKIKPFVRTRGHALGAGATSNMLFFVACERVCWCVLMFCVHYKWHSLRI